MADRPVSRAAAVVVVAIWIIVSLLAIAAISHGLA
jgi:hypothetical protein